MSLTLLSLHPYPLAFTTPTLSSRPLFPPATAVGEVQYFTKSKLGPFPPHDIFLFPHSRICKTLPWSVKTEHAKMENMDFSGSSYGRRRLDIYGSFPGSLRTCPTPRPPPTPPPNPGPGPNPGPTPSPPTPPYYGMEWPELL
ncbi:hypothetical protein GQ53DRAFT_343476 [Thozetella sp. PMI_491]|nr:hypothetical protein GQ53DRAFT_343476 [Thozetella sp. PMI_491]